MVRTPDQRHTQPPSRSMFRRLWLRSLSVKRPQSILAFAALALGAAVASLLMNLYGGAERKMRSDFRSYGPNVILAPTAASHSEKAGSTPSPGGLIDASTLAQLQGKLQGVGLTGSKVATVPVLYTVVSARSPGNPGLSS